MTLHEVNEASTLIQEQAHEEAHVIWGLVFDESMEESVRITVIATGFEEQAALPEERPERRSEKLFEDKAMPTFMKKNVTVDMRDVRPRPASTVSFDLDDDRYDIPTFLRKQAD
jgi:cell division protein FtsZ